MLCGASLGHENALRRYSNECDSKNWQTVIRMNCQAVNSRESLSRGR